LAEDFPGDVAFEVAHGFSFALAVGHPLGDVVLGSVVGSHAGEDNVVEGAVGLAVAAFA